MSKTDVGRRASKVDFHTAQFEELFEIFTQEWNKRFVKDWTKLSYDQVRKMLQEKHEIDLLKILDELDLALERRYNP